MSHPGSDLSRHKPKIFIGSSRKGLKVAELIKQGLADCADCVLWNDPGIFEVAEVTIDSLEKALDDYSHAIIVMSPDDRVITQGQRHATPRDNLIFELGLFVGRHGRRSAFMVAPYGKDIRLPSDLLGITRCHYKIGSRTKSPQYDVSSACADIERVLRAAREAPGKARFPSQPSKFWGKLSDRVTILFGTEYDERTDFYNRYTTGKDHPKISLRDLRTATEISNFLNRRYPKKLIVPIPSTTLGWHTRLQPDEDLILIGGFVTNEAYGDHREKYEHHFRVKMGRLCGIEGQQVCHIVFDDRHGGKMAHSDPQFLEDLPSEYVSRDYGLITSNMLHVHGSRRRVITIAGIKGHGTEGAAMALMKDPNEPLSLDAILSSSLSRDDSMEIVIASDVKKNWIDQTKIVEILLNEKSIYKYAGTYWESCELNRSCEGCDHGLPKAHTITPYIAGESRLKTIIFDLDDTLINTFDCLITDLEQQAAQIMVNIGMGDVDAAYLVDMLLRLRRSDPEGIEAAVLQQFPLAAKALEARQDFMSQACSGQAMKRLVSQIATDTQVEQVKRMLKDLRKEFTLYLLTVGPSDLQNEKIDFLNIRDLFHQIIVGSGSKRDKESLLASLVPDGLRRSSLVVGNRLDHEIQAGNKLGMMTVWVNRGEGSSMKPTDNAWQPDRTIYNITEFPDILGSLRTSPFKRDSLERLGIMD
jgi:FMN phosphatase YigB (HAD superfamily)